MFSNTHGDFPHRFCKTLVECFSSHSKNGSQFSLQREKDNRKYQITITPSTNNENDFLAETVNFIQSSLKKYHCIPSKGAPCCGACKEHKRLVSVHYDVNEKNDVITLFFTSIFYPPLSSQGRKRPLPESSSSHKIHQKRSLQDKGSLNSGKIISWLDFFHFHEETKEVKGPCPDLHDPHPLMERIQTEWSRIREEWLRLSEESNMQERLVFPGIFTSENNKTYAFRICYAGSRIFPHIFSFLKQYFLDEPEILYRQVSPQEMHVEIASPEAYDPERDIPVKNLLQAYPEVSCSVFRFLPGDIRYVIHYKDRLPDTSSLANCQVQVIEESKKLIVQFGSSLLNMQPTDKPEPAGWEECVLDRTRSVTEEILFLSLPKGAKVYQEKPLFLIRTKDATPLSQFDLQQELVERAATEGKALLFDLLNPNTVLVEFSPMEKERQEPPVWQASFSHNNSSLRIKSFSESQELELCATGCLNVLNIYSENIPETTCIAPIDENKVQGLDPKSLFSMEEHENLLGAGFVRALLHFWNECHRNLVFGEIAVSPSALSEKGQRYTIHMSYQVVRREPYLSLLLQNTCLLPNGGSGPFSALQTKVTLLDEYTIELEVSGKNKNSPVKETPDFPHILSNLLERGGFSTELSRFKTREALFEHVNKIWEHALQCFKPTS